MRAFPYRERHRQAVLARLLLTIVLFSGLAFPAAAAEVIQSFHAAIDVAKSGKITVTETIRVTAQGEKIRRGIFRDFPTTFSGDDGALHRVDFSIIGVERDGAPDDYSSETIDGGIRIYIGKEDVFLARGKHTYTITYETDRQIRYFANHDELFWNVTGNAWDFPIENASATVRLPKGVKPTATVFYTGPFGATKKNARVRSKDGEVLFATTIPLKFHEGLTIGVKLAKGAIDPPDESDELRWAIHDRTNSILALICLGIVLVYFTWHWFRVGRDPSRGVVVPRWDPPAGLSPALVNYVANRGFSNNGWTAFSASAIDLAVKGYIVLDDVKNSVTMRRTEKQPEGPLPRGEEIIYKGLQQTGTLAINRENGKTIQTIGNDFRISIDKEHTGKYYHQNLGVITGGIALTIVIYLVIVFFGDFNSDLLGLLVVPAFIFIFVAIFSAGLAAAIKASPSMVMKIIAGFFLVMFLLAFAVILFASAVEIARLAKSTDDIVALSAAGLTVVVATFFATFMGAATQLGRQLMDGVEGLRLYLTVAEQDRMNLAGAPEMSPQHFEKLLPYAVALGVEKPWSEHFQEWLDAAGVGAINDYQPRWYGGRELDSRQFGSRMSSFSNSLSTTIASTIPPPPSSSSSGFSLSSSGGGGGGGSSGGGGGGGGGGGW